MAFSFIRAALARFADNPPPERQTFAPDSGAALFAPPGHFYSPVVDPANAAAHLHKLGLAPLPDRLAGIKLERPAMVDMWQALLPHLREAPFKGRAAAGLRYGYDNSAYSYGDGSVLHAMIVHHRPRRVIEAGCGWSSACILDTVDHFLDGDCALTFIEPFPQLLRELAGADIDRRATVLASRIQDCPLAAFAALEAGDILVIDGSHVSATGSDVNFVLFEIMPVLRPGVIVHVHDIFWPFEYPHGWAVEENRSWNEVYALRAYLTDNPNWDIVFFNDYFARFERQRIERDFPLFLRNPGGALWLRRAGFERNRP